LIRIIRILSGSSLNVFINIYRPSTLCKYSFNSQRVQPNNQITDENSINEVTSPLSIIVLLSLKGRNIHKRVTCPEREREREIEREYFHILAENNCFGNWMKWQNHPYSFSKKDTYIFIGFDYLSTIMETIPYIFLSVLYSTVKM
jgi:hypothetical protein